METTFRYSLENQESERLIFRKIEESDFKTWLTFCKYPDSLKYIFSQQQLATENPIERCRFWFDKVFNRYANNLGGMNALVDKHSNEFIGQCGLLIQTVDGIEELEIGYSIMPSHRQKGYALEAAKKCKAFAFENNFRDSLISMVHVDNIHSAKVALANGMHLEKTIGEENDHVNIFRINKPNNK